MRKCIEMSETLAVQCTRYVSLGINHSLHIFPFVNNGEFGFNFVKMRWHQAFQMYKAYNVHAINMFVHGCPATSDIYSGKFIKYHYNSTICLPFRMRKFTIFRWHALVVLNAHESVCNIYANICVFLWNFMWKYIVFVYVYCTYLMSMATEHGTISWKWSSKPLFNVQAKENKSLAWKLCHFYVSMFSM